MSRLLVRLYFTQGLSSYLCFGPLCAAIFLIVLYYAVLWWLKKRYLVAPQRMALYKTLAGNLILEVILLPVLLLPVHFITKHTIFRSLAWSQTQSDREIVVQAIEDFKTRTGRYPETLHELVPVELSQVPALPDGASFSYRAGLEYSLSYVFPDIAPVYCTYDACLRVWNCD